MINPNSTAQQLGYIWYEWSNTSCTTKKPVNMKQRHPRSSFTRPARICSTSRPFFWFGAQSLDDDLTRLMRGRCHLVDITESCCSKSKSKSKSKSSSKKKSFEKWDMLTSLWPSLGMGCPAHADAVTFHYLPLPLWIRQATWYPSTAPLISI